MDTHFIKPRVEQDSQTSDFKNVTQITRKFFPVFVLAAILPFLIGFVVAPPNIGFFTRADTEDQLRVWLDPPEVVMSKGNQATFTVYASFDSETRLVPEIKVDIESGGLVSINNSQVTHSIPFSGREEIGKITVVALDSGIAELTIPEEKIVVTALEGELEITTSSAKVTIR